jgi:hypothetical protein
MNNMKILIGTHLAALTLFASTSCKKETNFKMPDHEKAAYRVLAIGKAPGDTSTSTSMFARTETVGLVVAEDSKLKAELIGYQNINGHGVYTLAVTNKQACAVFPKWGWDQLNIDSISAVNDTIPAGGYKVYTLIGDAKVGKIKLQAVGDCGNSSTLIVNITMSILPIIYLNNTAVYDVKTRKVTIGFSIDAPQTINWFIIQKSVSGVWVQVAMIPADDLIKDYSIKLTDK